MKKTIVYFMAAFILLGLAGCGNANNVGDNIQNNETESYVRVWDKNHNVKKVDYTYEGESCTIDNARLSVAKGREADVGQCFDRFSGQQMSDLRKLILIMTGLKNWQLNIS